MHIKNVRLLKYFGINGIVLYPFVFYASRHPEQMVLNHERIHLDQIRRDGFIRFYANYLKEYFQGRRRGLSHHEAYRAISYEAEAYAHQHDVLYAVSDRISKKQAG